MSAGRAQASPYFDLSRSAPAAWAGGLGVRLPAHATHEERPLFVVRTPIVNRKRQDARHVTFRAARLRHGGRFSLGLATLVGRVDAQASIALPN